MELKINHTCLIPPGSGINIAGAQAGIRLTYGERPESPACVEKGDMRNILGLSWGPSSEQTLMAGLITDEFLVVWLASLENLITGI